VGLSLAVEALGVPTVPVHTHVFQRLVKATALAGGVPTLRNRFVPQPVVGASIDTLRGYIYGTDPVLKQPFMKGVLDALTAPLTDEDLKGASFDRDIPRFLEADTEDNLQALFRENRWTDMMPVILPTEERVEAMLRGTSQPRDKIVGHMRPTVFREAWAFDVEKVAVNAVMAGAAPEHLPVILAMASSGITARSSSTTSFATLSVVNGPIRNELGMNDSIGALGPYNHANTAIGRAFGLMSQNGQGGSVPGETYMGSIGNWLAYSACFPEAEERSPWSPFHVDKGYKSDESTVSLFFGGWYTQSGYGPRETWKEKFIRCLTALEQFVPPLIVMDPLVARGFEELGFTKQKLIEWCAENARMKARDYWDDMAIQTLIKPNAEAGIEPYATRMKAEPDEMIQIFEPEEINIVVTGGETQANFKMFAGRYNASGGPSGSSRRTSTISIDEWR
jgi:hypothetical protein